MLLLFKKRLLALFFMTKANVRFRLSWLRPPSFELKWFWPAFRTDNLPFLLTFMRLVNDLLVFMRVFLVLGLLRAVGTILAQKAYLVNRFGYKKGTPKHMGFLRHLGMLSPVYLPTLSSFHSFIVLATKVWATDVPPRLEVIVRMIHPPGTLKRSHWMIMLQSRDSSEICSHIEILS